MCIILSIAFGVAPRSGSHEEFDIHHLIGCVLSISVACALTILLIVHLAMLAKNETTIEMGAYGRRNPFKKLTIYDNFRVIMGAGVGTWFLPIEPQDRGTDGVDYGINTELANSIPPSYQGRI